MVEFKESKFYKLLQDFFINNDKETFIQFLAEFYNKTEGIIVKNEMQDEIIKELREMFLLFNEEGIDENIVREKVDYFIENSVKIKDIIVKLITNTLNIENITSELDTKASKTDLVLQENKLSELINSSVNYITKSGSILSLNDSTNGGIKITSFVKNYIKSLELANNFSHNWFNNNVSNNTLINNIISFNYDGTWARNIVKITLPNELIGKPISFSFKAKYSVNSGTSTYVILGTTNYEEVNNDFNSCNNDENSFATYYTSNSGKATFIAKTNTLLISIFPTGDEIGSGTVELYNISVNEGANSLNYVPYEGYNIYSLNPILNIDDVIHKYENNHRYIFKGIEYERGKEYFIYIPQSFRNLRVTLNSRETENVIKTIKNWGAFSAGFISFIAPATGVYYLDIWSNGADSEEISFYNVYMCREYSEHFVDYNSNDIIELKSYDNNTVVLNTSNAPMEVQYFKRGLSLISDSTDFNIVTPEMFGAVGNGITDDTKAINECLNSGDIIIMKNNYLVSKTDDVYISLKKHMIPISLKVPSNKKILITGKIICNDKCNVFYVNGDNVDINGGTFEHGEISTTGNYLMGSIALNECTNINIQNVTSNNAIVTAFLCNYINTSNCISKRTASNSMNCAIGYHATSHSEMKNNTVLGTHNDGDLLCFGNCFNVTIDGNKLFSASDYWTDKGSQGICLDTACFKCKVINNYATGYYNPIDVKTWANGNIISNNVLYANKQGITIRRGEMNNLNNTDIISNNLIDLGGGNGSNSPIIGSESIGDYRICGIHLEGVSNG